MPYIKKEDRPQYDPYIQDVVNALTAGGKVKFDVGHLNYVLSGIVWKLFDSDKKYKTANDLSGVLSCVDKEFYRRKVVAYENLKIDENGDIQ